MVTSHVHGNSENLFLELRVGVETLKRPLPVTSVNPPMRRLSGQDRGRASN